MLALLLGSGAGAQAQTWTGTGLSSLWSEVQNWSGFILPVSSPSTSITFAGSSPAAPVQNLASVFELGTLSFSANAGPLLLTGGALRFAAPTSSLVQDSGNLITIAQNVEVAGNLVYSGTGSTMLAGQLSRSGANPADSTLLTKRGSGRLTLASVNPFDGIVVIDEGQVRLGQALSLGSATVAINVKDGLDLNGLPAATLGGLSGSGALNLGSTALTLGANGSSPAPYSGNIDGGAGSSITKIGSGASVLSGTSSFDGLRVQQGTLVQQGGSLQLNDASQGLMVGDGVDGPSRGPVLQVIDGAKLSSLGGTVQVDGAAGTLLGVQGPGSQLTTGFQTLVGNHARGSVVVANGAKLVAGTFLAFGVDDGGVGTLAVSGNGQVSSVVGVLGLLPGSQGNASIAGAGSRWSVGQMGLGGFSDDQQGGRAQLFIAPRGLVEVAGALKTWNDASTAIVNFGSLVVGQLESQGLAGSVQLQHDPDGGPALTINGAGGAASFGGTITGPGSVLKTGGLAQTLARDNSFSGRTVINGGSIVLGHALALQNSTVEIGVAGGLDLGGLGSATVGNLAGSGALDLGATQLSFGQNNASDAVYGGTLSGTTGILVKQGTGTSTLTGSGSSIFGLSTQGGTLVLSGGSLKLTSTVSGPTPALLVGDSSQLRIVDGAVVNANGPDRSSVGVTGAGNPQLVIEGAGSQLNGGLQIVVGNFEPGTATVRQGGRLNAHTYLIAGYGAGSSGLVSIESGGQATAGASFIGTLSDALGSIAVTGRGSVLASTSQIVLGGVSASQRGGTGRLSVADGAVVATPELLFWSASSTVTVDRGTLTIGHLRSGVAGTGSIELRADPAGGAALWLNDDTGSAIYSGSISGGGSLVKVGGATQVLSGANSLSGAVRVLGGTLEMASGAASEYEVGSGATLRLDARNLGYGVVRAPAGASVVYTGGTINGGVLEGGGIHDIQAVPRMVGTRISAGVALTPASGASFVDVASSGDIFNLPGRSLIWSGGGNGLGSLTVAGATTVSGWNSSGVIDVRPGGALVNTGSTLVLGGGSRTTIGSVALPGGTLSLLDGTRLQLSGALLVNNGTINGPVDVNDGSLAKGGGVYNGTVTIGDGGRFSPGNSPGTAQTGAAIWGAGGTYLVELSSATGMAGRDWDLWVMGGGLSITAGNTANSRFTIALATLGTGDEAALLAGFDNQQAYRWQIVDTAGGVGGFDPSTLALDTGAFRNDLGGGHFQLALEGGELFVEFTPAAVPEPETWALMLGGMVGIAAASRRRFRRT